MRPALFTYCEKPHKLNSEVAQHDAAVDVAANVGLRGLKKCHEFAVLGFIKQAGEALRLKSNVREPRE